LWTHILPCAIEIILYERLHTQIISFILPSNMNFIPKNSLAKVFLAFIVRTDYPLPNMKTMSLNQSLKTSTTSVLRTSHWILRYHWTVTNWTLFAKKVTFWSIYLGVQTPVGVLVMSGSTLCVQTSVGVLVMSGFYLICSDTRGCVLVMSGFYLICCNIRGEKNTHNSVECKLESFNNCQSFSAHLFGPWQSFSTLTSCIPDIVTNLKRWPMVQSC